MHPDWQEFLRSENADISDDYVAPFTDPQNEARQALDNNIMADCSDLGVLRFTGEDARDFLHNQLSNDVNALQDGQSRLAAYCNPKGRTLAVVRLFLDGDAIMMLLPRDILEAVAKRLRMFVLMSKVTIEDVSDEFVIMGLAGEAAAEKLSNVVGKLPTEDSGVSHTAGVTIVKLPQHQSRFLLIATAESAIELWQQLKGIATAVGHAAWQLLDIHTGQPQVHAQTSEAFVPQMLNMHAIDGISFKKGCYPGQEIVARMYYLGKLKRRMYFAHTQADVCPVAADPLFAADSDSGQGAGQVVTASPAAEGGYDLLLVCPVSIVDSGPIRLGSANGPEVEIRQLPYDVPLEREAS